MHCSKNSGHSSGASRRFNSSRVSNSVLISMGSTPVTRQKFSPAWRSSGVISFHFSFPVLVSSSSTSLSRLKIGEPRRISTDDDRFGWDLTMCGANDELKRRGDGKVGANARQTPTSPATTIPKCNAVVMRQYDKCSLFGLGGNISKRSARERERERVGTSSVRLGVEVSSAWSSGHDFLVLYANPSERVRTWANL